jgi:hypothetical protein
MTSTYEKIATTTLGSSASDVTFSTITGSYTDLVLICQVKASTIVTTYIQFNSDTGSNYSFINLAGNGSAASSSRSSNAAFSRITNVVYPDTTFNCNIIVNFQNYSNSTTYKTFLSRANKANSDGGAEAIAGLWRSTSAISTIKVYPSGGATWSTGSTFTLYGIKAE